MTRSKRSRNTRQNNTIARATATAAAIPNCKEQLVSDPIGIAGVESSSLATSNVTNTLAGNVAIAAPANTEYLENIDSTEVLKLGDVNCPSKSAGKLINGAPVFVQSAGETSADSVTLAVAAHPTSSPLEALDMNAETSEKEIKSEGSISSMAVSLADSSDSDYASVKDAEEDVRETEAEEDSKAECVPLLPEIPENSYEVAARPFIDSDTSDSSSDFTFDVDCKHGQNKSTTAPAASRKAVRPPPIFVNNIEDYNVTYAKKPRLDLASFKTLVSPADDAADSEEEEAKSRPLKCVSEEALASLSPTHIASDLLRYFVRTRAPVFMQRFVAPAQAPEEKVAETAAKDAFGSPVDNIVREPAPWELTFGSPLEDASRPPAPWADAMETEVDPLAVPLPDDEEIAEKKEEEDQEEMVQKKWYEDVPTSRLDFDAMQKEWDIYCAERSQKVAAMLGTEEKIAAAEAKLEAAHIAFKEIGATAAINKRKLSDQSPSGLNDRNLVMINQSCDNVIINNYLDSIVDVASSIKHRFLEADYRQQVWRRFTLPSGPGFGTGLEIALEYPTSANSQRDMRLAEDAAAQAMYYFNNHVEYARPPLQLTRDEVEIFGAAKENPAVFKKSGVILTRESDGLLFLCTANRPPLDLAISQSRRRASLRKRLHSDVWKAPPPPIPPGEDTLYYRVLIKCGRQNSGSVLG